MELSGSAQAWLVSVIRDMAADVAAWADFDLDAVLDLRMAVDEACLTLIGQGALDARLRCLPRSGRSMSVSIRSIG